MASLSETSQGEKSGGANRKPASRLINKNYKSLEQTRKEKALRRQIVALRDQGLSAPQAAAQLGISERTIYRYSVSWKGANDRAMRRLWRSVAEHEVTRVLGELAGLTELQQIEYIDRYLSEAQKVRHRKRPCHKLLVSVDADTASAGRCALRLKPISPLLVPPYVVNFRLVSGGVSRYVGQLSVG